MVKLCIVYSTGAKANSIYIDNNSIGIDFITNNLGAYYKIGKIYNNKLSEIYMGINNYDTSINDYKLTYYVSHYIYLITGNCMYRINTKTNSCKTNRYEAADISNIKLYFHDEHILYDIRLDSTSKTYIIHKHADMVNKLTLYLKEGYEIFCDNNSLHNITSNLIKSTNGYKCTSTGKCELWFREDPEELTYSII